MLKTSTTRLSSLKECGNLVPHPVCALDSHGALLYANDSALSSLNLELKQLKETLTTDGFKHFRLLVAQTLVNREKRESKQILEFVDGQPIKYSVNLQPCIDENNADNSFCVVTLAPCNEQLALENTVRALDTEVLKRRRADRQLGTQYAVSAVLAISKSLPEAAPNILHTICENLGWDWGGFWTRTSDEPRAKFTYLQNSAQMHSSRNIPEQLLENAQQLVNSIRATNRPAWISRSAGAGPEKAPQHPLPDFTSGSALALPVMFGNECSACMIFFSTENREPDKDILQMLMTLAGNIGQFIDHWRAEQLTRSQGLEAMRAETRLRAILSSMREGLCQLDSQGRCIYLNPAAEKMLGYELSAVRDQKMHDLIYARHLDGRDCSEHECPILSVMYTGKPRYNEEDSFLAKDQTLLTVQFSSAPLVVNGELAGVVIVFRDISELVKLRQQRDSFFAILTHDLKTPLLAADRVLGPLLKGASGPFNTEQSHVLALLKKSNSELLQMVQSVLALYRYSDNKALQVEDVDIKAATKFAVDQTSGFAASRKVSVRQSCATSELISLDADSTAIQHLIANLIENAIKYTPSGGIVDVTLDIIDETVQIEVRDSGLGLSEIEMANLFLPLQRKLSKRGHPTNSGLGLYLCKQIVESYKGHISCQSKEGFGATFTVTLPAARRQTMSTKAQTD